MEEKKTKDRKNREKRRGKKEGERNIGWAAIEGDKRGRGEGGRGGGRKGKRADWEVTRLSSCVF